VSYFRSNDQALRNKSGSCLRSLSASARFFVTHALPSARQFAASAGSALILASRMTLASTHLVLMEKSGFGSAVRAGLTAAHVIAPAKANLRANVMLSKGRSSGRCRPGGALLRRLTAVPEPGVELVDQLLGRIRDHSAGREDRLGAGLVQRLIILRRHHAADDDHDVLAAVLLQRGLEFRHGGEMGGRQRGDAEDMDVVLHRLPRRFLGGCKQRSDIN